MRLAEKVGTRVVVRALNLFRVKCFCRPVCVWIFVSGLFILGSGVLENFPCKVKNDLVAV